MRKRDLAASVVLLATITGMAGELGASAAPLPPDQMAWASPPGLAIAFKTAGQILGAAGEQIDTRQGDTSDVRIATSTTTPAVAAGSYHSCALTSSGRVKCWGHNYYGQLGDGTTTDRYTAVNVSGLTGVGDVVVGDYHGCALTNAGGVRCWGHNGSGQLGDGTGTNHSTPVDVSGLTSGVTAIAAGGYHTCALTSAGGVKCWGANGYGQAGDGTTTGRSTPVDVNGLASGTIAIATGGYHTCALTVGGGARCWGLNTNGQVGDGTNTNRSTPVNVSGLTSGVTTVEGGGYHTCARTSAGGVRCWGYNSDGELGDGTTTSRSTPVDVSGMTSGAGAVTAGLYHTCAVTGGGAVRCWGENYYGQLGDGTSTYRTTPVGVSGMTSGVNMVTAGGHHTCAVTSGGGVKCWGYSGQGQTGDGSSPPLTPLDVSGLTSGVSAVDTGNYHTCAVTSGGVGRCWGANWNGQLGDGTWTNRPTPADVSGSMRWVATSAGGYHTCALTDAGGVKCWGYNYYGQLGDGTTSYRTTPTDVRGLTSGVIAISAGGYHTCALTSAGGVKCWGWNHYAQLGDATTTDRSTPANVSGLTSGVVGIAAGGLHTCALSGGDGMKCWGYNGFGQLGDGTTTSRATPVDVSGLTGSVTAMGTGEHHTCGRTSTGGAKCWGYNGFGQLGDGTTTNRSTPVNVSGLTGGVIALTGGDSHTCAAVSGGAKCWGDNWNGQLGDGASSSRTTPMDVSGLASGVTQISCGASHTCALTSGGGVKCWGYDVDGQVGDGSTTRQVTPVTVSKLIVGAAFTDDPLVAGSTLIKVVHVTELRTQIDAARSAYGLAAHSWTDSTLTAGASFRVKHIADLRAALNDVYAAAGQTPPTYTDPMPLPGVTLIKAAHITELRNAIAEIK